MTIENMLAELPAATHPIARALHHGKHGKVLAIVMRSGMEMKEHVAQIQSTLLIIDGEIIYTDAAGDQHMQRFHEKTILPNHPHRLHCVTDAVCLLIQC